MINLEKSKSDKILEKSNNYDDKEIIASGILMFDNGDKANQAWTIRDLFIKNSFGASYEIGYCFYKSNTGATCLRCKNGRLDELESNIPCKKDICPLTLIK